MAIQVAQRFTRGVPARQSVGTLQRVLAGLGSGVFAFRMAANGGVAPKDLNEQAWSTKSGSVRAVSGLADYNPDVLLTREGLATYDKMRRDETVKGVLASMKSVGLATRWHLEAASQESGDKLVVEQLKWDFNHMKGMLRGGLKNSLSALDFGFSVNEMVLELVDSPWGSRVTLKRLALREPHNIKFYTDGHGNIREDGIEQATGMGAPLRLSPERFLLYSLNPDWDNPYGTSHLQAAYRSYFSKDWLIKWQNRNLERFGDGIATITLPDGETDVTKGLAILTALMSGTGIVLPSGYTFKIESLDSAGDAFEKGIKMHNAFIACALLQPNRLGFVDFEGGSYNLAETHLGLWRTILDDIREDLAEGVVKEQLLRRLVLYNNGPGVGVPSFGFDPLSNDDKMQLIAKVIEAVKVGLLTWTYDDEAFARAQLGVPMLPEDIQAIVTARCISDAARPRPAPGSGGGFGGAPGTEAFAAGVAEPPLPGPPGVQPTFRRSLFPVEERVEFAEVENRLKAAQDEGQRRLAVVILAMQDAVLNWARPIVTSKDTAGARAFSLPLVSDMRRAILTGTATAYVWAKKHARDEVARGLKRQGKVLATYAAFATDGWPMLEGMLPESSIRALKTKIPMAASEARALRDRAFWVTGIEKKRLAGSVKGVINEALETGDWAAAEDALRGAFSEYLARGEVVGDEAFLERFREGIGARAELVMHNAVTRAYNEGRMEMFRSPEVAPAVRGYEVSAILDDRTCDECGLMDGVIFEDLDAFDPPPWHHNDRCVVLAVLDGEDIGDQQVVEEGFPEGVRDANFE